MVGNTNDLGYSRLGNLFKQKDVSCVIDAAQLTMQREFEKPLTLKSCNDGCGKNNCSSHKNKFSQNTESVNSKGPAEFHINSNVNIHVRGNGSHQWSGHMTLAILVGLLVLVGLYFCVELNHVNREISSYVTRLGQVERTNSELQKKVDQLELLVGKLSKMLNEHDEEESSSDSSLVERDTRSSSEMYDSETEYSNVNFNGTDFQVYEAADDSEDRRDVGESVERSLKRGKRSRLRGNVGRKSNRRPKERRKLGLLGTHFKGGLPELLVQDEGLIAPWFVDSEAGGDLMLNDCVLSEDASTVQITENGLYLIYAQVYYITSDPLNSFSINMKRSQKEPQAVAYCSLNSSSRTSELSCYTAVIRYLQSNDQIYIQQRERNRHIIMRDGYTFLGLVRLAQPRK